MTRHMILISALLALGACTVETMEAQNPQSGAPADVPEQVRMLAAPYQDLTTIRLMPEDGCYWYQHVGPVETTMLPLRSVEGRPICLQRAVAAAPSGARPPAL